MTISEHIKERLGNLFNQNPLNNNNNNINQTFKNNNLDIDIKLNSSIEDKKDELKQEQHKQIFIEPNNVECEKNVLKALQEEPIRYIMKEMVKLGCKPPVIRCKPCDEATFGYYDSSQGLVICNNIKTYNIMMRNTVMHELIHAYDMCRIDINPTNCQHIACTEIRAANLSGDCAFTQELSRGNTSLYNHLPDCARRRAIKALKENPKCRDIAESTVHSVWDKCNQDYSPFTVIPK